jgi:hypothetical protein
MNVVVDVDVVVHVHVAVDGFYLHPPKGKKVVKKTTFHGPVTRHDNGQSNREGLCIFRLRGRGRARERERDRLLFGCGFAALRLCGEHFGTI